MRRTPPALRQEPIGQRRARLGYPHPPGGFDDRARPQNRQSPGPEQGKRDRPVFRAQGRPNPWSCSSETGRRPPNRCQSTTRSPAKMADRCCGVLEPPASSVRACVPACLRACVPACLRACVAQGLRRSELAAGAWRGFPTISRGGHTADGPALEVRTTAVPAHVVPDARTPVSVLPSSGCRGPRLGLVAVSAALQREPIQ